MLRATVVLFALAGLAACGGGAPPPAPPEPIADPAPPPAPVVTAFDAKHEAWWSALQELCGQAYAGRLVSTDPDDAEIAGDPMVMHVRECSDTEIRIPFHVGENRSRTWIVTRDEAGLELKHDHRHIDGEIDAITQYGGHTVTAGTGRIQHFPADESTQALFDANDIPESKQNVWSLELRPGKRFSYILRRPKRWFQADFDLSTPVEAPPPPWGHP